MYKKYVRENGSVGYALMFHDDDGKSFDDPKLATKQCFKEEADINTIIRRSIKAGVLPQPKSSGFYGDFSEIGSYQDAAIKLQEVDDMFMSMPAELRARFENDPSKFLDYVDNPDNVAEMIQLGLVDPIASEGVPEGESDTDSNTSEQ